MAEQAAKKTFKVPHTFVILFFLIVVATIGTYVIPAGVYDRVTDPITNRSVVDPLSYHLVEATPVGFFEMFISLYKGLIDAGDIIFFIMISYGTFYLILESGAPTRRSDPCSETRKAKMPLFFRSLPICLQQLQRFLECMKRPSVLFRSLSVLQ